MWFWLADDFQSDFSFIRLKRLLRFSDLLRNYSSNSDMDHGDRQNTSVSTNKIFDTSRLIRSVTWLNCSLNEYSQHYASKKTRISTFFSRRFFESHVYYFTIKASWNWIVLYEYDIYHNIYNIWQRWMEYCSISIIYRPKLEFQFQLTVWYPTYQNNVNQTYFSIQLKSKEWMRYLNNDKYVKNGSDYAIPNLK